MANAYKLYEKLNEMDVPDDMKHMSLSIARDGNLFYLMLKVSARHFSFAVPTYNFVSL